MELSANKVFAHTVWAAHILSGLSTSHDKLIDNERLPDSDSEADFNNDDHSDNHNAEDDDEEEYDSEADISSDITYLLVSSIATLHEKSLDCIAELLSRKKGWHFVTAAALREQEDSVEIDVARNFGFDSKNDEEYLALFSNFIVKHAGEQTENEHSVTCSNFLDKTIEYYSDRVDGLVLTAKSIWKRVVPSSSLSNNLESIIDRYNQQCILHFRDDKSEDVCQILHQFTKTLLSRVRRPVHRRRELVLLAHASVLSKTLPDILSQSFEKSKAAKALKTLKLLSRPVTNLQILALAARTLSSFQSLRFCTVTPPAAIRIQRQYIVTLQDAWDQLGLPAPPQEFQDRIWKANTNFKENCSQKFSSHAEVQLVQRYEESPWLSPSIDYIGCSKKACLLCESFLELSPWHPRLRGRHGFCHPRWGVSFIDGEHQIPRIEKLVKLLKDRILRLMDDGISAVDRVAQSSLISALDTLDIKGMDDRAILREAAKSEVEELRESLSILNDPRSRGPKNIFYTDIRTLCIMCQFPRARPCKGCWSSVYCSTRCQIIDWPSHKLLCTHYMKTLPNRPSPTHRLGIWFPQDNPKPKLVWISLEYEGSTQLPNFDNFLGTPHCVHWSLPFSTNQRRGLELDHSLELYYEDYSETPNKSIFATAAISGSSVPHEWCGNVVAISGRTGSGSFTDITLSDFRHFLDYFTTYWDGTIRENPNSNSIWGVQVNSPAEQLLHGADTFVPVSVPYNFPGEDLKSGLSRKLGVAVNLYRIKNNPGVASEDLLKGNENPYYSALLLCADEACDKWGVPDVELHNDLSFEESFLLLREDRSDLDLAHAVSLCRYCNEILRPLFEKSMMDGGESVRRNEVLEAIQSEKLIEFGSKLEIG